MPSFRLPLKMCFFSLDPFLFKVQFWDGRDVLCSKNACPSLSPLPALLPKSGRLLWSVPSCCCAWGHQPSLAQLSAIG